MYKSILLDITSILSDVLTVITQTIVRTIHRTSHSFLNIQIRQEQSYVPLIYKYMPL